MLKLPSHALPLKDFVRNWQSLVATLSVLQTIRQDLIVMPWAMGICVDRDFML